MNILVSGASGYIGSALVPKLKEMNYSVFGIDRVSPIIGNSYFDDFLIEDLSKLHTIYPFNSRIDILIHLAGESRIDANSTNHHKDNYIASKNLYRWAINNKIKKIIMLSSIKVHGQGSHAASKKMSENVLIELCNQKNTQYTILRSSPIYGEGMKGGLASWLKRYTKILIPDVRHSESVFRLIGVNDLCAAIIFCLENTTVNNRTYEISDNINYKIKDIDHFMKSVIWNNKKYIQLPRWLLWLASIIGDLIIKIGLRFPFSIDRYAMLYKNKPKDDYSFFREHTLAIKESFLEQIPLIIGKVK